MPLLQTGLLPSLLARQGRLNNSTRAREDSLSTFCSTVCEFFAVKGRNSAQRGANPISQDSQGQQCPQLGENVRKNPL